MLNVQKKKEQQQKNCQKSKIFTILYITLIETLPRSMLEFWGANLLCGFRQDVVWSFFLPYGPMLKKTKQKMAKNQNLKLWSRPSQEVCMIFFFFFFWVNPLCTFRGDVVWHFSPMWSHVNENAIKNRIKSKMQNFEKQNKKVWRCGEKVPFHQIWHYSA